MRKSHNVIIRKVKPGDETVLANIQTESWRAAFSKILDSELLDKCTDISKAVAMYKQLLVDNIGNGYILTIDDKPHCISYWDAARDKEYKGKAELICIHSLPDNWHKGFGSMMMDHVLSDIKKAEYSEVVLWVFRDNVRAKAFYEAKGFEFTGISQPAFGTEEVLYSRKLQDKLGKGYTIDEIIDGVTYRIEDHLGNRYPTIAAMCAAYGAKAATYRGRIRAGKNKEEALTEKTS